MRCHWARNKLAWRAVSLLTARQSKIEGLGDRVPRARAKESALGGVGALRPYAPLATVWGEAPPLRWGGPPKCPVTQDINFHFTGLRWLILEMRSNCLIFSTLSAFLLFLILIETNFICHLGEFGVKSLILLGLEGFLRVKRESKGRCRHVVKKSLYLFDPGKRLL